MKIYAKLFKVKENIGIIVKDSKNPYFKSNYLSLNGLLDAVEPVLNKNGLMLLQPILDNLVCTQIIEVDTGNKVESKIILPNIQDPQKLGSAITYYRRYTLQSLLGLQAEDDDGNNAIKKVNKEITKPLFTKSNFERAKLAGATIDKIKSIYTISEEVEKQYLDYVRAKK